MCFSTVGFTSDSYEGLETVGFFEVCVGVLEGELSSVLMLEVNSTDGTALSESISLCCG